MKLPFKRVATDAAGYGLILLGVAFGWLPGPGGIPLILAGLGLLSINNKWAADLRGYLEKHGGKLVKKLFPDSPLVQALYDGLVAGLFVATTILCIRHAAVWQISLAVALFFGALVIAGLNRDRAKRLKHHISKRSAT